MSDGRERGCRNLVEQRLEQVVVGAIDQDEFDIELVQMHRRLEATETAADDDDDGSAGLFAGEKDRVVLAWHRHVLIGLGRPRRGI